jgi:hypothetical protein
MGFSSLILPVLEGMGKNIDFFGVSKGYRYSFLEDADEKAFESDIRVLKRDFDIVLRRFNERNTAERNTSERKTAERKTAG